MKKLFLVLLSLFFIFISCNKEEFDFAEEPNKSIQIDNSIFTEDEVRAIFEQKNYNISWKDKNHKLIFSAGVNSDGVFAIGFKPAKYGDISNIMNKIDLNTPIWKNAENKILKILSQSENKKSEDIIIDPVDVIPTLVVKISNFETYKELIRLPEVRYIEPLDDRFYAPAPGGLLGFCPLETLGCNCTIPSESEIITGDSDLILPQVQKPWNYEKHKINNNTWSISSGSNIGVAVIDSGVSHLQENLDYNADLNSGYSSGRVAERINFLRTVIPAISFPATPYPFCEWSPKLDPNSYDRCGHGTKMAGLIGAPRGGDNNSVGIAYNCNLFMLRAAHNPLINTSSEKIAVKNAMIHAANDNRVHIISMSIGQLPLTTTQLIEDAINFADAEDKMMICAAGTTFSGANDIGGVIFPANHIKTIAVTGIKAPDTYPNPLEATDFECSDCHYGPEVDFVTIMERFEGDRTTISVTCEGDIPVYTSGSSCATASVAGMAALIWSNESPNASRSTVLSKMISASSNNPTNSTVHNDFGYGWIDVYEALQ